MHQRETIRNAVKTMLSGQTDAGTNVYTNRKIGVWTSELPAVLIYTLSESNLKRDTSGRQSIRTLDLAIELKVITSVDVSGNSTVDSDLDDLAEDVENIISANPSLSGTALGALFKSSEVRLDVESEKEIGVLILTYEVKYIL